MPTGTVDPLAYRRAVGRFATGVAVVTACQDGVDAAMTVNSLTSVSLSPVLVLVCIERSSRLHDAVVAQRRWAVSVLDGGHEGAARWLATRGRPDAGQLEGFPTRRAPVSGALVFTDALAVLECATWATYDGGDHTIVVGEVEAVQAPDEPGVPLIYWDGGYRRLW